MFSWCVQHGTKWLIRAGVTSFLVTCNQLLAVAEACDASTLVRRTIQTVCWKRLHGKGDYKIECHRQLVTVSFSWVCRTVRQLDRDCCVPFSESSRPRKGNVRNKKFFSFERGPVEGVHLKIWCCDWRFSEKWARPACSRICFSFCRWSARLWPGASKCIRTKSSTPRLELYSCPNVTLL